MIYEVIITTTGEKKTPHVAPMGIVISNNTVILKPFKPSLTLDNILLRKTAILNVTTDVRIFAGCVLGKKNHELVKIEGEEGYGLKNASSRTVLELIKISDDKLRPELFMRKKNCVQISNFLGFNRAQSAVIEAAILVSRLKMLPKDKIINEMKYLKIAVEKTAGPNEKEAWLWLTDSVNEFISRH